MLPVSRCSMLMLSAARHARMAPVWASRTITSTSTSTHKPQTFQQHNKDQPKHSPPTASESEVLTSVSGAPFAKPVHEPAGKQGSNIKLSPIKSGNAEKLARKVEHNDAPYDARVVNHGVPKPYNAGKPNVGDDAALDVKRMHKMTADRMHDEAEKFASRPITTTAAAPGPSHSDVDLGDVAKGAARSLKEKASSVFQSGKAMAADAVEGAKEKAQELKEGAQETITDMKAAASEPSEPNTQQFKNAKKTEHSQFFKTEDKKNNKN